MKDELLSVQVAADELGRTKSAVQKMVESGELPARPIDELVKGARGWAIRRKDLEKVRDRKPGPKPKKGAKK